MTVFLATDIHFTKHNIVYGVQYKKNSDHFSADPILFYRRSGDLDRGKCCSLYRAIYSPRYILKIYIMKKKFFTIISLTDAHIPFEDKVAMELAIAFCAYIQPNIIVMHEFHDFYALSRFDKDPLRETTLQDEIDQVTKYFWAIRKVCPKSRIILLKSNHTDRLKKYMWREAPGLASLRDLKFEKLLELDKHDIEYMDFLEFRGIIFKHGNIVRKKSGMSARAEFEKEGMSGVSGHTHRLGINYFTLRGGEYMWMESGCLCDTKPEYIDGIADWKQGLSLVTFIGDSKQYFAVPIPIIDNSILYDGFYKKL